jgi:hypothetical protein
VEQINAVFMYLDPGADPAKHRAVSNSPGVKVTVVGVPNLEIGAKVAKQMVKDGVHLIELCAGFGYAGSTAIQSAVGKDFPVGMISFQADDGPALGKFMKKVGLI